MPTQLTYLFALHRAVFFYDGSAWTQRGADLNGAAAGELFGTSEAISSDGTIVAAGGPRCLPYLWAHVEFPDLVCRAWGQSAWDTPHGQGAAR